MRTMAYVDEGVERLNVWTNDDICNEGFKQMKVIGSRGQQTKTIGFKGLENDSYDGVGFKC